MSDRPNPGSPEAIEQGCTCPVLDNANGRGAWGTSGDQAMFWVNGECPLHGDLKSTRELRRQESVGARNAT